MLKITIQFVCMITLYQVHCFPAGVRHSTLEENKGICIFIDNSQYFFFALQSIENVVRWSQITLVMIGCIIVCLFRGFRQTRQCFTHMETSPLPVMGCNYWPMLGTHGHWAVRVFRCHTYCDTGHPFIMVISCDTIWRAFGSGDVTTCFMTRVCRCWDSNTQHSACEANSLTQCATAAVIGCIK